MSLTASPAQKDCPPPSPMSLLWLFLVRHSRGAWVAVWLCQRLSQRQLWLVWCGWRVLEPSFSPRSPSKLPTPFPSPFGFVLPCRSFGGGSPIPQLFSFSDFSEGRERWNARWFCIQGKSSHFRAS